MIADKLTSWFKNAVTAVVRRVPGLLRWRVLRIVGIVFALLLIFYYPIGMALTHAIDDDPMFQAPAAFNPKGGSRAVAIAAALIERETDQHRWTANDPFFLPPAALDNMPNYQQGIISALARFAFELVDQIGRTRGSSKTDEDLQKVAGELQYSGKVWVFDLATSIAPTTTSEARYRSARRHLLNYNQRLADGDAVFERRTDNLLATLDRIALDLGASSAAIDKRVVGHSRQLLDFEADDVFYNVKGQLYAYYLVLRELGLDFENVIADKGLASAYAKMLESMRVAALIDPLVVVNGDPSGQFLPSHLSAQGFFLLRARTKLREITNILLK